MKCSLYKIPICFKDVLTLSLFDYPVFVREVYRALENGGRVFSVWVCVCVHMCVFVHVH